jgi:hypothetical protein
VTFFYHQGAGVFSNSHPSPPAPQDKGVQQTPSHQLLIICLAAPEVTGPIQALDKWSQMTSLNHKASSRSKSIPQAPVCWTSVAVTILAAQALAATLKFPLPACQAHSTPGCHRLGSNSFVFPCISLGLGGTGASEQAACIHGLCLTP